MRATPEPQMFSGPPGNVTAAHVPLHYSGACWLVQYPDTDELFGPFKGAEDARAWAFAYSLRVFTVRRLTSPPAIHTQRH